MNKAFTNSILFIGLTCCLVCYFYLYGTENKQRMPIVPNFIFEINANEIREEIEKYKSSQIVTKLLLDERNHWLLVKNDFDKIQNKIVTFCANNRYVCKNINTKKIIDRIQQDELAVKELDQNLKMSYALSIAKDLISNKANLQALLVGKIPDRFYLDWSSTAFIGGIRQKDDRGSHNFLGLVLALAYIGNELKEDASSSLLSFYNKEYPNLSYVYGGKLDLDYTFKKGKDFVIFDDSVSFNSNPNFWISDLFDLGCSFDTVDLMSVWSENEGHGLIFWNNDSIKYRDKILKKIRPVHVGSVNDIIPGMIIAERYFLAYDDIGYNIGIGGRMAVVLGVYHKKNQIITMSYSKQIYQGRSGFGIDLYDYKPKDSNLLQMFFKIN